MSAQNLATRSNNGITVSLDWNSDTDEVTCRVNSATSDFTITEIPHPLALDVYHHPFAYADRLMTAGTFAEIAA